MQIDTRARWIVLICICVGLGFGCGGPAPKKVDVAAKIAELKGDGEAKQNALTDLSEAGPNAAAAVDSIIPLLKDPDHVVRRLAAYTLGEIGQKAQSAVPALKEALGDPNMFVVMGAGNALRNISPKDAPKAE